MPGALLHAARNLTRQVPGERAEADQIQLRLHEILHERAADARPGRQREREVLGQRQRAEERAGLEEDAERRHAAVDVRLADAVDVDAAGHRLLQADQVPQQRALAAARPAENGQGRSALDLEADVLHQHAGPPSDPEVLDDDVRPGRRHVQIPSSVKNSVKSALITITPKMASTTAVVVRAPTAAAPPRAARPCPQAMSPMISAEEGRLDHPVEEVRTP